MYFLQAHSIDIYSHQLHPSLSSLFNTFLISPFYWLVSPPVTFPTIPSLLMYISYISIPFIPILTRYIHPSHHFHYISYTSIFQLHPSPPSPSTYLIISIPLMSILIIYTHLCGLIQYISSVSFLWTHYISIHPHLLLLPWTYPLHLSSSVGCHNRSTEEAKAGRHVSNIFSIVVFFHGKFGAWLRGLHFRIVDVIC